ncbi:MAG: response regulator transcription factor [Acidimicrobiales bacterium]
MTDSPMSEAATALLVSDAPSVRRELASVLGGIGIEVREVATGAGVTPAVRHAAPDLVVLDLQIGNMGGMAACMDLRLEESADRLPHVPVLMLLDRRADVFLARRSGAEGYVVKPLDPIRLRKAIRALLGGGTYHDTSYLPVPTLVGG